MANDRLQRVVGRAHSQADLDAAFALVDVEGECKRCHQTFMYQAYARWPGFGPGWCDACARLISGEDQKNAMAARNDEQKARQMACSMIPNGLREWDPAIGNNTLLNWVRKHGDRWMWVSGPNDRCKSRSVARASLERIDHFRESVCFVRCVSWFRELSMGLGRDEGREALGMVAFAKRADILVMDDLGKEVVTARVAEVLFDIVDHRDETGGRIWITTNHSGDEVRQNVPGKHGTGVLTRLRRRCEPAPPEIVSPGQ